MPKITPWNSQCKLRFGNAIALIFTLLLACGGTILPASAAEEITPPPPVLPVSPYTIQDDAGNTVTLAAPATRIVPMYAAFSQMLVHIGKGATIAARTNNDDAAPQSAPVIGTHMRPNLEVAVALAPDMVLIPLGREEADQAALHMERLGFAVARFRLDSFEAMFSCIQRLGILTGAQAEAQQRIAALRQRLDAVAARWQEAGHKPSVFFEIRYPNLLGAGAGGMLHDVLTHAGGRNVLEAHTQAMARVNEETLPALDPDVYVMQQGPMNKAALPPTQRPHFQTLRAVATGRWLAVPEHLFSRPSPQSVDAVEALHQFLYPQLPPLPGRVTP
ncbi:ABC transporter substrate-binding protein [Desulfovibrio cuneatus]|uniref:ABC transporter substrate-binding protein n=1 Tax=Desulfovibrio cuneatus TaxID=159728 RepID=UPI0003FE4D8C|nr:ABC transporter substrate-binding protein [Desulfovibrio cuneatus]